MANTVVIVTKDMKSRGGVANYFRLFFAKYHDRRIRIQRFSIGSRSVDYYARQRRKLKYLFTYCHDLKRLIITLRDSSNCSLVHVNPSLIPVPLIRDGIIVLLTKVMGRKVVVFFHGWDNRVVQVLNHARLILKLFVFVYTQTDRIVVLAERFKDTLVRWGIPPDVIDVSSTAFDGDFIAPYRENKDMLTRFLFLSRISREKGVFDIIEAASILRSKGLRFHITFVGYGRDIDTLECLKYQSKERGVLDICSFRGYLDGEEKFIEYSMADIFLLPTYHPEGCPTVVLEAMASGLFVISTDVGGLKEIVKDGVNGKIVLSQDPKDLAEKMEWTITNIAEARRLGKKNRNYAFDKFESTKIVRQIIDIYKELLDD